MPRSRSSSHIPCVVPGAALALAAFLLATRPAAAAETPAPPKGPVSFINDVAPILKENCFGCHGAKNPKGKLDMTKFDSFQKGGTKDTPFAAGKPDDSLHPRPAHRQERPAHAAQGQRRRRCRRPRSPSSSSGSRKAPSSTPASTRKPI